MKNKENIGLLLIILTFALSDNRLQIFESLKWAKLILLVIFTIPLISRYNNTQILNNYTPFTFYFFIIALFTLSSKNTLIDDYLRLIFLPVTVYYISKLISVSSYQTYNQFLKLIVNSLFYFLFIGLVLAFVGWEYPWFIQSGANFDGGGFLRFRGLMGNPNGLGLLCLFSGIFLRVVYNIRPQLFSRKKWIIIIVILCVSLVLSNSRNSLLAIALFLLFDLPLFRKSTILSMVLASCFIFFYTYFQTIVFNFLNITNLASSFRLYSIEDIHTASGRDVAHEFVLKKIQENMLEGHGYGATEKLFRDNQEYLNSLNHQGNAHNSFLTIWYESGLFGLLIFVYSLFHILLKKKKRRFILPLFVTIFFSALNESFLVSSLNIFTLLILTTIAIIIQNQNINEKEKNIISFH